MKGQYNQAVKDYAEAIRIDPSFIDAFVNRGRVYFNMGKCDLAIDDYSKAVGLDPGNPIIRIDRGNAFISSKQYEQAIKDFKEVITLDPKDVDSLDTLANLLRQVGNPNEAKDYACRATEIDPSFSEALGTLAEIYSDLLIDDKFYEYLEKALETGYPLLELLKDGDDCKPVYAKHKDEERFIELMKEYRIEIPDSIWDLE